MCSVSLSSPRCLALLLHVNYIFHKTFVTAVGSHKQIKSLETTRRVKSKFIALTKINVSFSVEKTKCHSFN